MSYGGVIRLWKFERRWASEMKRHTDLFTDKEEYKRQQHNQLMILFYDPSSSNIDPFHALGQEASPGSDVALHHCKLFSIILLLFTP